MPGGEDDIIPTAIVIKNIPFSVKRETLLEIIVRVYYHFVSWYTSPRSIMPSQITFFLYAISDVTFTLARLTGITFDPHAVCVQLSRRCARRFPGPRICKFSPPSGC